jgi:glutathione synthase
MKLLFVADVLENFKTHKDSTFAMMREATARGHTLMACEPKDLRWQRGEPVIGFVRDITLTGRPGDGHSGDWFSAAQAHPDERPQPLHQVDAVLMRKDPPFDSEYFYATHLLSQAEREGARVFNRAAALREHPEKLAVMEFPQFIGPTLVTRDASDVKRFHAEHGDIICKPLDGMGGAGIFRVGPDAMNLGSIIETLNQGGAQTLMVQKYLPEITQGDKRVLVIGGEPMPFVLARIPQGSEIRGNLAVGGKGVAQPITEHDREVARSVGAALAPRGLLLIGLDIIGTHVTEINVTSPTGFQEIAQQTGFDVAARFIDALEAALAA